MKKIIFYYLHKYKNLVLYGLIGLFTSSIDFFAYFLLTSCLDVYYIVANVISVTIGITLSFILNRKYNFKITDNTIVRFIIFFSVGIGGMLLSSLLLYVFIDIVSLNKNIAKVLSIVLVVLLQYILNKTITFKKKIQRIPNP